MQEIFKFEDKKRDTDIRLLKDSSNYILEVRNKEETLIAATDTDMDYMTAEYTTFIMGYVIRLKRDGIAL